MKVIFPFEKEPGGKTKYPDDIKLFGKTERIGSDMVAEYFGILNLTPYTEPELPAPVNTATLSEPEFKRLVLNALGINCT